MWCRIPHARCVPPRRLVWLLAVGLGAGSATVALALSPAQLEDTARRIEDLVVSQESPSPPAQAAPRTGTGDAAPEIRVNTPELMKAIESRRANLVKFRFWKRKGCIMETNQGLVVARDDKGGCHNTNTPKAVIRENKAREEIYRLLMQQNKIPASDEARLRAAFARVYRDRTLPGEWMQDEGGSLVRK